MFKQYEGDAIDDMLLELFLPINGKLIAYDEKVGEYTIRIRRDGEEELKYNIPHKYAYQFMEIEHMMDDLRNKGIADIIWRKNPILTEKVGKLMESFKEYWKI